MTEDFPCVCCRRQSFRLWVLFWEMKAFGRNRKSKKHLEAFDEFNKIVLMNRSIYSNMTCVCVYTARFLYVTFQIWSGTFLGGERQNPTFLGISTIRFRGQEEVSWLPAVVRGEHSAAVAHTTSLPGTCMYLCDLYRYFLIHCSDTWLHVLRTLQYVRNSSVHTVVPVDLWCIDTGEAGGRTSGA